MVAIKLEEQFIDGIEFTVKRLLDVRFAKLGKAQTEEQMGTFDVVEDPQDFESLVE